MSDQGWATLVGLAVIVAMRVIDYVLPRGWHWRGVRRWAERDKDEE